MKIWNFLRNKIIFVLTFSVFISALFIFPVIADAATWYVSLGGRGNSSSWAAASSDLKNVLLRANSGDEVWVKAGTYSPGILSEDTFTLKKGVKFFGGFAGGETQSSARDFEANETILSGNNVNYHVVICENGATSADTRIDGFTITGGKGDSLGNNSFGAGMYCLNNSSPTVANCAFTNNYCISHGGGLFIYLDTIIENCSFINNTATGQGGGVYVSGNGGRDIIVKNCEFTENTSLRSNLSGLSGGGMHLTNCRAIITDCVFTNNNTNGGAGGLGIEYMYNDKEINNYSAITNCVFTNNTADFGGGFSLKSTNIDIILSSCDITNCTFTNNTSESAGGLLIHSANNTLTNCVFTNNTANGDGGGAFIYAKRSFITNCAFNNNITKGTFYNAGGGLYIQSGGTIENCTFSGNSAGNSYGGGLLTLGDIGIPSVINCTFSDNTALMGGGAIYYDSTGISEANITNSIFWKNSASNNGNDVAASQSTLLQRFNVNNNIFSPNGFFVDINNIEIISNEVIYADPLLISFDKTGAPANSSDEIYIYGLLPGSPAIDAGMTVSSISTDQRGIVRPQGLSLDIGAYEAPVTPPVITTSDLHTGYVGTAYNQSLAASGTKPINWSLDSGSLPLGLTLNSIGVISGTPTTTGLSNFTVRAENEAGSDISVLSITISSASVAVTGVTVTPKTVSGVVGGSQQLTAEVFPANAANKNIYWSIDNNDVAYITSYGDFEATPNVMLCNAGTATITAHTADGSFTDTCVITVTDSGTVPVTGVTVESKTASVSVGEVVTITAPVSPANATLNGVHWSSSNPSVATVTWPNHEAIVYGVAPGTARITVRTLNGGFEDYCDITVTGSGGDDVAVTGLSVEPETVSGVVGGSQTLTATVFPADATNKTVYWISNNENVTSPIYMPGENTASLTFNNPGTAVITARTADGSFTDTCVVTVTDGGGGTIHVTGVSVEPETVSGVVGSSQTLTAMVFPTDATNKTVYWISNNENVTSPIYMPGENTASLTFNNPGTAIITARTADGSFTDTCVVTVTDGGGGTIPVTGVSVTPETAEIDAGGTRQLAASVYPTDATDKTVYWSSGNTSIASVSASGLVTGVSAGTAVITARTADGSFTDTCVVTVSEGSDSQLYFSPSRITAGKDNTFTVTFKANSPQLYDAVQCVLEFDPNYLEFIGVEQIPPAPTWLLIPPANDDGNQRSFMLANMMGGNAVLSGDNGIATVTFKALAETSGTDIRIIKLPGYVFGSSVLQYQENDIDFSVRNTSVAISEGVATLKASFQSRPATGAANVEALAVRWIRDNAVIANESVTTDENGQAQILVPMPNDGLSIWVKGERTLSVVKQVGTVANASVVDVGILRTGDSNGDNGVDIRDFNIFANNFGMKLTDPKFNRMADYNNDKGVDIRDFNVFASNFGNRGTASPAGSSATLGTIPFLSTEINGELYSAGDEGADGGSGCNAAAFAVFALLIITPLFKRRR